jgi:hypothetical protein
MFGSMKSHLQGCLPTVLCVTSDFKLKEGKQQCIQVVNPAYQYSIMTLANSPTYEAFSGQPRRNTRVLLVHNVSGMTPST